MSTLFITGTGTDVGKTIVTTLLVDILTNEIGAVFPYKPVQAGGANHMDLSITDEEVYGFVINKTSHSHCTYHLQHPYSPHLAAKLEQKTIDIELLQRYIKQLEQTYKGVVIEGAGGLFVPITEDGYCMIHLIKDIQAPTVLVAPAGLGTINHTVLSIKALTAKDIPIMGIILNFSKQDERLEQDNIQMIKRLTDIPIIGTVPFTNHIHKKLSSGKIRQQLTSNWNLQILKKLFIQE